MKYIKKFRCGEQARHIAANIAAEVRPDITYNFMEFCGGHTHAISRYGIADLLPPNVRMIQARRAQAQKLNVFKPQGANTMCLDIPARVVARLAFSGCSDFVAGCARDGGEGLRSQLTFTLQQQFDFGWCQPPQFGRGTELLIQ